MGDIKAGIFGALMGLIGSVVLLGYLHFPKFYHGFIIVLFVVGAFILAGGYTDVVIESFESMRGE